MPAVETISILSTSLLLVEGKDEVNFFRACFQAWQISGVQIIEIGGKTKFKESLPAITKIPGFSNVAKIGLVRDADANCQSAFDSVCYAMRKCNLPLPTKPGKIATKLGKHTGVYIHPDNNSPGMIEDLCLRISDVDMCYDCVEKFARCVKSQTGRKLGTKAHLQALLAARKEVGLELGVAALQGAFDLNHSTLFSLRSFCQELFG